ncbi:MAG: threonine synthase [Neomegalonema sp.]|nr:threonine synthase [Neomegalonema sp.]
MRYISTRGAAPELDFEEALLAGLARDGGLYLPTLWPKLSEAEIAAFAGRPYEEVAAAVAARFTGDAFSETELLELARASYADFRHPSRAPLIEIAPNFFVLELHRGPTLAFKDFAMRFVARLFEAVLTRRGQRATIVGATSGDTGSAAIDAFQGLSAVDVFILYPDGRVSDFQRRQMTTPTGENVHALAIEGSFDDCQAAVKAMFNDFAFRDRMKLAAVNSINWARVLAQTVYYFTAAVSLGAPARKVSFSVPTGNFGDIFAGWAAKQMGLPIERLLIATNENDILHRCMATGRYEVSGVKQTTSPSMDIQVSSNFERALFEAFGRDPAPVVALMDELKGGAFDLPEQARAALANDFDSARASEAEVAATIKRVWDEAAYLLDPHTAVGVHAATVVARDSATPIVALACAHPAKFGAAVQAASGQVPEVPGHLADLLRRAERFTQLPNELSVIQSHIEQSARPV